MPVKPVGTIIPRKSRLLTNRASEQIRKSEPQPRTVINSFEFQAGFVPAPKAKGSVDHAKVQHFIDSIV